MNRKQRRQQDKKDIEWKIIKDPNYDGILHIPIEIGPEKIRDIIAKLKSGKWVLAK